MQIVVNMYVHSLYTSKIGGAWNLATRGRKINVYKPDPIHFLIIDFSRSVGKGFVAFQILYEKSKLYVYLMSLLKSKWGTGLPLHTNLSTWFHPLEFAKTGGTKYSEDVGLNSIIHSVLPSMEQHLLSIL